MLSISLGFSAGVMVYISFTELLSESKISLATFFGEQIGSWLAVTSFFLGMGITALIDKFVPSYENPHEPHIVEDMETCDTKNPCHKDHKLHRMGIMTAIVIALHNFPEGIATFAASITDIKLGFAIALAVAIHNIPEGIAVSVPIYCATGSKKKAFIYSFLSGLAEPLGAVVGYFLLSTIFNDATLGLLFGATGGIMVYLAFNELLPTARKYGTDKWAMSGVVSGMLVMAVSILLFF
jgi:ZIP family zinc transporter